MQDLILSNVQSLQKETFLSRSSLIHTIPPIPPTTLLKMPLDTSSYSLALLRLDGRRWNELRRLHAQISTQASADGSSYLEMGNTKVICTVTGPSEQKPVGGAGRGGSDKAEIRAEISVAGFSGVERKRRGRTDKYAFLFFGFAHVV